MFLTAFDPDLLIYSEAHWRTRQHCFYKRAGALAEHRDANRYYGQSIAISHELAALVYQSFPWHDSYRSIPELRDLRQFVLEDLGRVCKIMHRPRASEVTFQPEGVTCVKISDDEVIELWKDLLAVCLDREVALGVDFQIATWPSAIVTSGCDHLRLSIFCQSACESHRIPLVWSGASWKRRLRFRDFWPDLHRCVELYSQASIAGLGTRGSKTPVAFDCTDDFWKSVSKFCQPTMRHRLIKAVSKKVHGIHDATLGDERIGSLRRFRVTKFWRVHYRDLGDRIVLDEFGPHDMGI